MRPEAADFIAWVHMQRDRILALPDLEDHTEPIRDLNRRTQQAVRHGTLTPLQAHKLTQKWLMEYFDALEQVAPEDVLPAMREVRAEIKQHWEQMRRRTVVQRFLGWLE